MAFQIRDSREELAVMMHLYIDGGRCLWPVILNSLVLSILNQTFLSHLRNGELQTGPRVQLVALSC